MARAPRISLGVLFIYINEEGLPNFASGKPDRVPASIQVPSPVNDGHFYPKDSQGLACETGTYHCVGKNSP